MGDRKGSKPVVAVSYPLTRVAQGLHAGLESVSRIQRHMLSYSCCRTRQHMLQTQAGT